MIYTLPFLPFRLSLEASFQFVQIVLQDDFQYSLTFAKCCIESKISNMRIGTHFEELFNIGNKLRLMTSVRSKIQLQDTSRFPRNYWSVYSDFKSRKRNRAFFGTESENFHYYTIYTYWSYRRSS